MKNAKKKQTTNIKLDSKHEIPGKYSLEQKCTEPKL